MKAKHTAEVDHVRKWQAISDGLANILELTSPTLQTMQIANIVFRAYRIRCTQLFAVYDTSDKASRKDQAAFVNLWYTRPRGTMPTTIYRLVVVTDNNSHMLCNLTSLQEKLWRHSEFMGQVIVLWKYYMMDMVITSIRPKSFYRWCGDNQIHAASNQRMEKAVSTVARFRLVKAK